jgi:cyclic pyranopterin monophosphate synthase
MLRYRGAAVKLYSFDVNGERLDQLPLAARRALDHAGWKLSRAGWLSLDLEQRRGLARLGSGPVVDVADVARQIAASVPAASACDVVLDPPREAPPAALVEALAPHGRLSAAVWVSLDALDRYALQKVAWRADTERMQAAYEEIIGYRQISTHLRPAGGVQMVNVGAKAVTERRALAESQVSMNAEAFELLQRQAVPKGDVLGIARVAGILAAKRTSELIPLCHAVPLTHLSIELRLDAARHAVYILASVHAEAKTGVEMEALVAVSHAALTVYDMLKAVDRGMQIGPTRLLAKSGGASGDFVAEASVSAQAGAAERGSPEGA